jgi:glycine C-acetyltransferase/8-amino-7-oxononanoate synthase
VGFGIAQAKPRTAGTAFPPRQPQAKSGGPIMSTRRTFLRASLGGFVAFGCSVRELLAQPAAAIKRYLMEAPPGTETVINGKRCLYFGGTSYYTLQNHPDVIRAAHEAIDKYGMHSSTSRASGGYGNTPLYEMVESTAARFFGTPDAAYMASGFLTNVAAFQSLRGQHGFDVIFQDAMGHYSLVDFSRSFGLPVVTFAHRDAGDLAAKLKSHLKAGEKPLVISDGIFPVPGEIAPVPDYISALEPYDGLLWLDDCHAMGVIGENGRGTYDHFKVSGNRLFFGGTMSKAIGGYGGIVPTTTELAAAIRGGHIMAGATMPPSAAAGASVKGMQLLMEHPEWRSRLWANAKRLKDGIRAMGFSVNDTVVPVVSFPLKTSEDMLRVHAELTSRGIIIQHSHYVGAGPAGVLRMVAFATHTDDQIDRLLGTLKALV